MIQVTFGSAYHEGTCSSCGGGAGQVVLCVDMGPEEGMRLRVRICGECRAELVEKIGKLTKKRRGYARGEGGRNT
jgi:hypothetical protein